MDVRLTNGEVALLKELVAAGDKGRTVSARTPPLGLIRLVRHGYVLEQHVSVGTHYTITVAGKHALIRHEGQA